MNRKKLVRWIAIFFGVILLFTFLSRAADSVTVAKVDTAVIQNKIITHTVQGTGKIQGTQEKAVFAPEDQKVDQVLVGEGETVEKGQVLLTLSGASVKQAIKERKQEIDEQERKINDLKSQETLKKQEKERELKRAEENYDTAVKNGEINMANAQMEVDVAKQKLQIFLNQKALMSDGADASTEQALRDEIRARQESQNQVIMTRNQEVQDAARALEDAKTPDATDSTIINEEAKLETLQEEAKQLAALKKQKGKITAPCDGVIKSISSATGSTTTGEAAVILYTLEGELRMEGSIRESDLEYIKTGETVSLKGSNGNQEQEGIIESIQERENNSGDSVITVKIPEGAFSIGENVDFTISKDQGPYTCSVPLSAVYEENGTNYIYVTENQETILGETMVARRVSVRILDKNDTTVALENGSVSSSEQVIINTSKTIEDGSRVRLREK